MKSKEKVTLKYSNDRNEFILTYPEYTNRNGKITANFISSLYDLAESKANELGYKNLSDYFECGGFDIKTFTISVNAKLGQTINKRCDGDKNI